MSFNPNSFELSSIKNLIDVAAGRKKPDIVLSGNVFSVFTGECFEADVAIYDGIIAGIGDYTCDKIYEVDCLLPGFIDAHIHIESSHLHPSEFAKAVLKHGTTAIIADPHEIVNVCGKKGMEFMIKSTLELPVDFYFTIPSCVPAVKGFETYANTITPEDVKEMLQWENVIGLAEVMNYPAVINCDDEMLSKIYAVKKAGKVIDGHSPGLVSLPLNAYILAGVSSDHECTSAKEAMEKLRRGMKIMIREGSTAKNLRELAKIVSNYSGCYTMLVCDDITSEDLRSGHIDERLRLAVRYGIKSEDAIRMVTLNPSVHYSLNCGAIVPGYKADLVSVNGFDDFKVNTVVKNGKIVWRDGNYSCKFPKLPTPKSISKFNMVELNIDDLKIPAKGKVCILIKPVKDQITTEIGEYEPLIINGEALPDPEQSIAKIVVIDRHLSKKLIGKGFVEFRIEQGAIASSYSHDSHNCVCVGVNDKDMLKAINEVKKMRGGFVAVMENEVVKLSLQIAGLMSELSFEEVISRMDKMRELFKKMHATGVSGNPLIELSFLTLPVIPKIRITDFGLIDVENMKIVDLWIEN